MCPASPALLCYLSMTLKFVDVPLSPTRETALSGVARKRQARVDRVPWASGRGAISACWSCACLVGLAFAAKSPGQVEP